MIARIYRRIWAAWKVRAILDAAVHERRRTPR